jgi:hypothetical protein
MIAMIDWRLLTVAGVLLLVAMVLLYRLLGRDPNVRNTRYGFFIERDRFEDEEPPWPDPEKTAEYPSRRDP